MRIALESCWANASAIRFYVRAALLCLLAVPVAAAPPGREWTPIQRFVHADHDWMQPDRFEPTAGGKLELLATGIGGISSGRTYGFAWRDTTWVPRWHMDAGSQHVWPCLNDSGVQMLVYLTFADSHGGPFYMAFVEGDTVTPADSIDSMDFGNLLTVGARSKRLMWAGAVDINPLTGGAIQRLYSKRVDAPPGTPWTKLGTPPEAIARTGVYLTMSAASESTCVVIWGGGSVGSSGLFWGVINDTGWVRPPTSAQHLVLPGRPTTRRNPDGSLMTVYGSSDSLSYLRTLLGETWSDSTEIHWTFPLDQAIHYYLVYNADMSFDTRPLPVLSAFSYNTTNGSTVAHVSVPDSGRYGRGEWIRGSERAGLPWVARDENGDVWLAWSRFYDGVYWLHSHVTATCAAPTLTESSGRPRLNWTLTDRTPESAWMVLRSVDDGPYEPVDRVIAQNEVALSYLDRSAPSDRRLRYRIRRESRDKRYLWESEPSAEWLPRTRTLGLRLRSGNPVVGSLDAELTGAPAGEVELRLLDLQGRTVLMRRHTATGTGRDALRVSDSDAARLRPGLYLLRVRSAGGAESRSLKIALLR